MSARIQPGRLITAMVTPFAPDGSVDYAQARRLALALIDSGTQSIVVAGTTGEAPTLRPEEKLRLFGEIKDAVGDRGAVPSVHERAIQLERAAGDLHPGEASPLHFMADVVAAFEDGRP